MVIFEWYLLSYLLHEGNRAPCFIWSFDHFTFWVDTHGAICYILRVTKTTLQRLDNDQLRKIAPLAGTTYAYLRQLRSGYRRPSVDMARGVAKATKKALSIELSVAELLGV